MAQKFPIDSAWFVDQLKQRGKSLRALARFMAMDAAAVSRMLNGQRNMSAAEQDKVAAFLDVGLLQIAAHRGESQPGFAEQSQEGYVATTGREALNSMEMFTEADIIYKDGKRWMQGPDGLLPLPSIYGCMQGTLSVVPGVDLTAPMDWDYDWGEKLYNE